MSSTNISVDALVVFAQKAAQDSYTAGQKAVAQDIRAMKVGKEEAKSELAALKARNDALQKELAVEKEDSWFGNLCDGWFGRSTGDVSEDIAENAIEQQAASISVSEAQKDIADTQKDLKDANDEYTSAQQGFQEIFRLMDEMAAASSKLT